MREGLCSGRVVVVEEVEEVEEVEVVVVVVVVEMEEVVVVVVEVLVVVEEVEVVVEEVEVEVVGGLSGDADPKVFQRLWSPQPVPLEGMKVLEVACGTCHMMALVTEQRHHPKHIRKKVSPGVHFVNPRAVAMGCRFQGPHRHPTNAAVAATPATPPRPTRHGP
ncbi:unnamed protein product [Boreogadus saida]